MGRLTRGETAEPVSRDQTLKREHAYFLLIMVPNQVIGEVVLDGGGRFISPTGIVGVHTLSLLLSSQAAHDRAACNNAI